MRWKWLVQGSSSCVTCTADNVPPMIGLGGSGGWMRHKSPSSLAVLLLGCTLIQQLAPAWRSVPLTTPGSSRETKINFLRRHKSPRTKQVWAATTNPTRKPCRVSKTSPTSSGSTPSRQHAPQTLGKSFKVTVAAVIKEKYAAKWKRNCATCTVTPGDARFTREAHLHVLQIILTWWRNATLASTDS